MTINAIKRRSDPVAPKINPGTNWTDIEINGVKPKDMSFGWVLAETRIWIWSHWWRNEVRGFRTKGGALDVETNCCKVPRTLAASHNDKPRGTNGSRKKFDINVENWRHKSPFGDQSSQSWNHQNRPKTAFKLLNIIVVMLNYPKIQQKSLFSFDSSTLVITLRFLGICDDHGCSKSQADVMALVVFNNIISILIIWIMLIVERLSLSSG